MHKIMKRTAVVVAATAAAACAATTLATSASADPGDPITGGTTTVAIPQSTVLGGAKYGFTVLADSPATESNDSANSVVDFNFPVSGGDGAYDAQFGHVEHSGGLSIYNANNGTSASLGNLNFNADTLVMRATPGSGTKSVKFFTLTGSNTESNGPAAGQQRFTSSAATLDAGAAKYLDKALGTNVFRAGENVGSFDSTIYNTQY